MPGQRLELEARARLGRVRVDEVLAGLRAVVVRLAVVRDVRERRLVRRDLAHHAVGGGQRGEERGHAASARAIERVLRGGEDLGARREVQRGIAAQVRDRRGQIARPEQLRAERGDRGIGRRDLGEPERVQLAGRHRGRPVCVAIAAR